jgi:twitching motility protein PilT
MELLQILSDTVQRGASDLHLGAGLPPLVRINGTLMPLPEYPLLSAQETQALIYSALSELQRQRLEQEWELDFSVGTAQGLRFRGNAFRQKDGLKAIFRVILRQIPTPTELTIPAAVLQLTNLPRGLVLVTGPTGSGKSTTLACLVDVINQKRREHIITIEDPIEFIHENKNCEITQREVGTETRSFVEAVRHALRQDPNIVLVGEMRDLETISATITLAETGHLVFATLHTPDVAQTVDRIVDVFPAGQQQQIRTQLASCLKAVIGQTLVPRADGKGRIAVREIMLVTPAIATLIRDNKAHQIYTAIDTNAALGMISMDKALAEMVSARVITKDDAMARAQHPELFSELLNSARSL